MRYSELCSVYGRIEGTTKKLEKTGIIAGFLPNVPSTELEAVVLLLQGRVFPAWSEEETGVASKLAVKAISKATGIDESKIIKKVKETGDYGLAAEHFSKEKKQQKLFTKPLEISEVHEKLQKLSLVTGAGSVSKKLSLISELLGNSQPAEARYLTRTILGELRIGVAEGLVRDAISKAYNIPAEAIEKAYDIANDFGRVAKIAKEKGAAGLEKIEMETGKPLKVMLAQKVNNVQEAIEALGKCAFEYKYDGARMQIHKQGKNVRIFTRRLDEVTKQFPDIVESVRKNISTEACIIEGEAIATDPKTGKPLPFQNLSRRIKRKYDIEKVLKEIPCRLNLFDINFLNGKNMLSTPFAERRKTLEKIVKESGSIVLAKQLITDDPDEAERFYQEALELKQEGLMAKKLEAGYKPGSRVGYMLKIKPTMETLDLVIVGAEWGEGRRAKWLASFLLACRDTETGEFPPIGRMGTGLSDELFTEMTETLKPLILTETGKEVSIHPKIVVEVAYEEIQKSPTYGSGYALRFPRLVRVREDRGPDDATELSYVDQLYAGQK